MKRSASLNSFFSPATVEQCKAPVEVKADAIKMEVSPLDPLCVDISFQPDDGEPSTSLCANEETPSRFTNEVLKLQRERKENVERAIALADEQLTFITQLISSNDESYVCSNECAPATCRDMNLFAEVSLLRAQCKELCDDVERLKSRQSISAFFVYCKRTVDRYRVIVVAARWSWFGCLTADEMDGKEESAYGSNMTSNADSSWSCVACSHRNQPELTSCSYCSQVRSRDVDEWEIVGD
ncbi:hypothetical protein TTRE_0000630201 [Trichuris trichiura]|uniref:RanBP2-type domain-containing protein n=1 Tax=Trichuris trichiura TaxID=36087 RepID=A0A077ZC76_TRITR|nr:hypothetical protein TTRE_0000630201 [Trichuris trichiura]